MDETQQRWADTRDRLPLFEGLIVSLGEAGADCQAGLRIMRGHAKRTGLEKWSAASVGPGSRGNLSRPLRGDDCSLRLQRRCAESCRR